MFKLYSIKILFLTEFNKLKIYKVAFSYLRKHVFSDLIVGVLYRDLFIFIGTLKCLDFFMNVGWY